MKMFVSILTLAFATTISAGPFKTASQQSGQRQEAGRISKIKCKAYIRKLNESVETELKRPRDEGRTLYALDQLRCIGGGQLELQIYSRLFQLDQSYGWYLIPETNSKSDEAPGAGRVGALKGTYKLDPTRSPNPDALAFHAIPKEWVLPLTAPYEMAIELKGKTVTIASTMFPTTSFEADGREHQVINKDGKTIRSSAFIEGEQLTVNSRIDSNHKIEVVLSPQANGELKLVRRLYTDDDKPPAIAEAVYHRISDVARFDLYSPTPAFAATPGAEHFRLKSGDSIVAELDADLSSKSAKKGDKITLTVRHPSDYAGAKIDGHVELVRQSSNRVELVLSFDLIRLSNGNSYPLVGRVESIREPGKEGKTTVGVTRTGTTAGAIIGGAVGVRDGAAVGAALGGTRPGTIYDSLGHLELERKTEILIRVVGP